MHDPVLDHATLLEYDQQQLHPYYHPNAHKNPLVAERGEGVWLYTADGQKVLDGMAGLWNVNIGYGNEELALVAYEQMKKLAYTSNFVGMTNQPSAELAHRMAGIAHPTLNSTFFTSGGSESNDSAFKTARYYWYRLGKKEKIKFISRQYAYHGITLAATAATGIPRYHTMFGPIMPGFIHIPTPYLYRYAGDIRPGESIGQAAARALEECIVREGPETVAAFIAEPIQGVGGVLVPPDDYFPLVREICDRYDVLLILDEVITGFGRTGMMFGQHQWNLRPDIMSFAKGITSGYIPLGGIQISDAIREVIDTATPQDTWMHGFTYSGHATACAVGLKNLEIIARDRLVENSADRGTAAERAPEDAGVQLRGRRARAWPHRRRGDRQRQGDQGAGPGQGDGDRQCGPGPRPAHAAPGCDPGLRACPGHQRRRGGPNHRAAGECDRRRGVSCTVWTR